MVRQKQTDELQLRPSNPTKEVEKPANEELKINRPTNANVKTRAEGH